jgi:hypothetical protein
VQFAGSAIGNNNMKIVWKPINQPVIYNKQTIWRAAKKNGNSDNIPSNFAFEVFRIKKK